MDILRQGSQIEVVSPPSLRKLVADRLNEAGAIYVESDERSGAVAHRADKAKQT
jgi:hypothetical protein